MYFLLGFDEENGSDAAVYSSPEILVVIMTTSVVLTLAVLRLFLSVEHCGQALCRGELQS
ncbi:hypothetical protein NDU88_006683, partial [Pleurodeles waltl]